MADDFKGSIAQLYITFSTAVVTTVVPGENYYKVMLFAGHVEGAAYFVGTEPAVGVVTELTASTYAALTEGALNTWLSQFFADNVMSTVLVVTYDDSTVTSGAFPAGAVTALTTQFTAYSQRAYFKMMTLHDNIPANSALATLCAADTLLSQCWIDANDAQMLVENSTTSMYGVCHLAGSDPVIIYHPGTTYSPCLTQLGLTLSRLNTTGTPVGNSLDYLSTDAMTASGTAGANLLAADITILNGINSGFVLTVGDTTGAVAVKGGKTIKGNLAGAQWLVSYIDYVCAVKTANYLTQFNKFKNNETYQGILALLTATLKPFEEMGRLSDLAITAPAFSKLPAAVGDMITVPDAWEAYYNDNVRKTQIQGTLYITQS
jgi:hypothetical protein